MSGSGPREVCWAATLTSGDGLADGETDGEGWVIAAASTAGAGVLLGVIFGVVATVGLDAAATGTGVGVALGAGSRLSMIPLWLVSMSAARVTPLATSHQGM